MILVADKHSIATANTQVVFFGFRSDIPVDVFGLGTVNITGDSRLVN